VVGPDATRTQILLYTLLLAPVGVLPAVMSFAGLVYGAVAAVGGALMLLLAWRVYRLREGEASVRASQHLFGFSILYLFLLFATLLVEHAFGIGWPGGLA
jgi:protoheme IX farnesyltransferase